MKVTMLHWDVLLPSVLVILRLRNFEEEIKLNLWAVLTDFNLMIEPVRPVSAG